MTTNVRHATAPTPNGCRWCGVGERDHVQLWTSGHGWHAWAEPTTAQRKARMLARRVETSR